MMVVMSRSDNVGVDTVVCRQKCLMFTLSLTTNLICPVLTVLGVGCCIISSARPSKDVR